MAPSESQLDDDIEILEGLPVFVAYNANVDAIVHVDENLEAALDRPDDPGQRPPPSPLTSKRDLARAITHTMRVGRGDEVAMTNSFASTLEGDLTPDKQQMGGQAGIMTNLLTALGAAPITYTYLVSERQQSMFDRADTVRYPLVGEGTIEYVPMSEFVNAERTKMNWVFEFRKGDTLFGVQAIEDTRFIAASRPPEFDLVTGELDMAIDQVGADVDGALLAGYHNLTPEHVDEGYEEAHRHARDVIRRLRSGGAEDVHIEYAVTHDEELRSSMFEWILPEANVMGADSHELSLLAADAGIDFSDEKPTEETPFEPDDILRHHRMLSRIRATLDVECIRLHAMEYHLAVMDAYLPPNAVRRGLEFAAINAATKASIGSITDPSDLETGLEYARSEPGKEAIDLLANRLNEDTEDGTLTTAHVVACPNRVVREPTRTVGIGDIVSASSFILELALATRGS